MRATFTLLSLTLVLLTATIAKADTITFHDVNDVVTVTTTGTRFTVYAGTGVGPFVVGLFAPTGGVFSGPPPSNPIAAAAGFPDLQDTTAISTPDGLVVSDVAALSTTPNTPTTFGLSPVTPFPAPVALFFEADSDGSPLLCSAAPHGCQMAENGTVQTVGAVTWTLPTGATVSDSVFFQVTDTPEPSFTLVVGLALLLGGIGIRKFPRPGV